MLNYISMSDRYEYLIRKVSANIKKCSIKKLQGKDIIR